MKNNRIYSETAETLHIDSDVSFEELEEIIEQQAREEEADNIVLAEDKRELY